MTKNAHHDAQYDLYDLETLQEVLEKARPFAKQGTSPIISRSWPRHCPRPSV